eukprot:9197219-Karenia_brevis.AAC.1
MFHAVMGYQENATSRQRGGFGTFRPELTGGTAVLEPRLRSPGCTLLRSREGGVILHLFIAFVVLAGSFFTSLHVPCPSILVPVLPTLPLR